MLYLVFFILLAALVAAALFLIKVYIKLSYKVDEEGDHIKLAFYALNGLIKVVREVGPKGIKEKNDDIADKDADKSKRGISEVYDKIIHFKVVYRYVNNIRNYIERKADLEEVKIHVDFGTGDACITGISGGLAWSATGIIISFFSNRLGDFKKDIKLTPDFSQKKLNIDLHCIFKTRIVYIIVVGLKYLTIILKQKIHNKSKTNESNNK
jgi:hypothetical protein